MRNGGGGGQKTGAPMPTHTKTKNALMDERRRRSFRLPAIKRSGCKMGKTKRRGWLG